MKISICLVTHHKPYMIITSLISLALQKFTNYDLHIVFIKGDGSKKKYPKYDKLIKKFKKNVKLSNSSNKILLILKNFKKNKKIHIVDNDQALDSGAWIKFINKKIWKKYDYSFFLMEGFIFKNNNMLENLYSFLKNKKPNVVMLGAEKIFTTKKRVHNYEIPEKKMMNKFNLYHQEIIDRTFKDFNKISNIKKIYSNWKNIKFLNDRGEENLDIIFNFPHKNYFSLFTKIKLYLKYIIKENKIYNPFQELILFNEGSFRYLLPRKFFFKKESKINDLLVHEEKSPYFYVNGCQHIYSKKYLNKLHKKFNFINIKKILNYPFVGTPLEFIWGLLPASLGFKKWHADAIHRPRKNFLTYQKEDTAFFMSKYLKMYSNSSVELEINKNEFKIKKFKENKSYIKRYLGNIFFKNN